MKEKKKPAYELNAIKSAFDNIDTLRMTATAMQGQYDLGFSDQDVVDAIQALTNDDFYKSMAPFHAKFTSWQDVYKSTFNGKDLYIKFQVDSRDEMIISFKEK